MKIVSVIFFFVLIGGFLLFRSLDYIMRYKERQAGKKYCQKNKLKFLKTKNYALHTRLYFEKDGIESWANYETDRNENITWKKETPVEKIEIKKRSNKNALQQRV